MLLLLVLWAQADPAAAIDLLPYLGPFIVFAVPTSLWIRDKSIALKNSEAREQVMADRLIEFAEKATPVLAEAARVNHDAAEIHKQVLDELRWLRRNQPP